MPFEADSELSTMTDIFLEMEKARPGDVAQLLHAGTNEGLG